jgi:NitT/TauT family transport system permease protein
MKFIGNPEEGTAMQKGLVGLAGLAFVILVWVILTNGETPIMSSAILPSPMSVIRAFPLLISENELFRHVGLSIGLNLGGYIEAIAITLPIGFIVGLMKYFRWGFHRQIDAFRYVPLTAVLQLFIFWFGIATGMKMHFLAFGIIIFLLPVMIQRIDEVDDVYLKTVHTLGATDWQVLKTVYFPSVISRLFDDIRVLTAISWTYIIVAETTNSNQGGIGALLYNVGARMVRPDKLFALLVIIILIGFVQDKLFVKLDKVLFPFKYQAKEAIKSSRLEQKALWRTIFDFALLALGWIITCLYLLFLLNEFVPFLSGLKPLSYLFGDRLWAVNLVFFFVLFVSGYTWYKQRTEQQILSQLSKTATT